MRLMLLHKIDQESEQRKSLISIGVLKYQLMLKIKRKNIRNTVSVKDSVRSIPFEKIIP